MAACPDCGTENQSTSKFCKSCGTRMGELSPPRTADPRKCPGCSAPVPPDGRFCKQCGNALNGTPESAQNAALPTVGDAEPAVPTKAIPSDTHPEPERVAQPQSLPDAAPGTVGQTGGRGESPGQGAPVAEPIAATEPAVTAQEEEPGKPTPYLMAGVALVLAAVAGGGYFFLKGGAAPAPVESASHTNAPVQTPAPAAASVASVPAPVAEEKAMVAVSPSVNPDKPAPSVAPATVQAPASANPAGVEPRARPESRPSSSRTADKAPEPARRTPQMELADKTGALLARAESYLATQQYDKAVATGENALLLDPDNAAAKALIRRAKARQLDALRSGTSLD